MKPPQLHREERVRLQTVRELGLLASGQDEAFERVIRLAKSIFGVPISAFSIIDGEHQRFIASSGLAERDTSRDVSFCGHTILQDDVMEIADTRADPRFADNPLVTGPMAMRFYAGAPVLAPNGLPVGALCLIDRIPRRLDDNQRQLLLDLRDVLQNELRLRAAIFRDHLTQLFNRRFLDEFLEREMHRAARENLPLSVVLIDIDHFKLYNDTLGHVAGDEALRRIAAMIEASCWHPGAIAARYGGEEFAVVLPNTNREGAAEVIDHIRDLLANESITNPCGIDGVVTLSAGAVVAQDHDDLSGGYVPLLRAADQMLYFAKKTGRNRAEIGSFSLMH